MQPVYSHLLQRADINASPTIDPVAMKSLGRDLRMHAEALHQQLLTWQHEVGRTVIHGDFKTANLFFRNVREGSREVPQVSALSPVLCSTRGVLLTAHVSVSVPCLCRCKGSEW